MQKDRPLISVIIPSLNQAKYIRTAINSILSQSYHNYEVIVCDGGSIDGTQDILKQFGERVNWNSEPDLGQTDAINKGISRSHGEVICFLNSDDQLLPDALQIVADSFANKDVLWLSGDYKIIDENGHQIQQFVVLYKRVWRNAVSKFALLMTNFVVQPSTFWRKELGEKVGKFDVGLRYTMDYDYWLRLISIEKPIIINEQLSAFRIHHESKGGSMYQEQFAEELEVAKRYTKNGFLLGFHKIHNWAITSVYSVIKK